MSLYRLLCRLSCLAVVAVSATLSAQESTTPQGSQPPEAVGDSAAGDPASAAVVGDESEDDDLPREQTIYIPYEKFREIFEKPGRGVFLPYEEFQRLWQAARARPAAERPQRPPVGALLNEISSEARVENDVVRVTAELKVEILRRGWHEIPLRLRDAAVQRVTSDDIPVRLLYDAEQGHKLLIHQAEDKAEEARIKLEYAKSYSKSPSLNSVQFEAPQAPVNRWKIVIPEPGVKVDIHPLIAASEEPGETPQPNESVLLAFVGAAPQVRIDWTPKSEGAAGLEAIANVTTEQQVSLEEGVLRTRTRLDYSILRAELETLKFDVPTGQRVTGVFDANVRRWIVEEEADLQVVTVELFQPARGQQSLLIELERFFEGDSVDRQIPMVRAREVSRQQGVVVVQTGTSVQIDSVERSGLLQVDLGELPARLANGNWTQAYRFSTLPFELTLKVTPVRPKIDAQFLAEAYLQQELITVELLSVVNVERTGIFELEFELPAGYELVAVAGQEVPGAAEATVDTYHVKEGRLVVDFRRKLLGRSGLRIVLRTSFDALSQLTPGGESFDYALAIPRLVTASESREGRLAVFAPASLRVQPSDAENLRTIPLSEVFQPLPSQRQQRYPTLRPILAYQYTAAPFQLSLGLQRRRPHISVAQLLTARVESGVVAYQSQFFFDVLYSGVKSLRLDIPQAQSDVVRNVTPGVRDQRMQPQPEDIAPGYVAWQFTGDREFEGRVQLRLQWEQQNEELEIGGSVTIQVPRLSPRGVDRAWGQIVLTKSEALDLQPEQAIDGLRPIDPQHDLMSEAQVPDAARAFEFHDEWTLPLTATRYRLEDIKRTSIERGLVRMVVTRSRRVSVQALYRVKSTVQRLAVRLPEGVEFDADPLRVNGQPRNLERGDEGTLYIPLGTAPGASVLLELRYTLAENYRELTPPWFPDQPPIQSAPAVQKVYLAVHLADDLALLGWTGPWSNEAELWELQLRRLASPESDDHLVAWVGEGTPTSQSQLLSFPTDGNLHLFSTLRPPPPPVGTLELSAMSRRALDGFMFCSIGLIGLIFLRRSLHVKVVALILATVSLIALGVFWPTLAQQLLEARFFVAVCAVLLLWLAAGVMHFSNWATASAVRQPVPATAGPSPVESPFAPIEQDEKTSADEEDGGNGDA